VAIAQQAPFESGSTGASLSNTSGTNTGDVTLGAPKNGLGISGQTLTLDTTTLDAGTLNINAANNSGSENLAGTLDAGTVVTQNLLVKASQSGGMTVVENNTSNTAGGFVKHFLQASNTSVDVQYQLENPGQDTTLGIYHGTNHYQLVNGLALNTNVLQDVDPSQGNHYVVGRLSLGPFSGTQSGTAAYLNAVPTISYVQGSANGTIYNIEEGVNALTAGAYTATLHFSSGVPMCTCNEVAATPLACGLSADPTNTSAAFAVSAGGSNKIHWRCEGIH